MPNYDYRCNNCGELAEEKRHIDDRDMPKECICGGEMFRTVISSMGIQFKGTGFYKTDNKR